MKPSKIIVENSLQSAAAMFMYYNIKPTHDNTKVYGEVFVKYSRKAYDLVCAADCLEFRCS